MGSQKLLEPPVVTSGSVDVRAGRLRCRPAVAPLAELPGDNPLPQEDRVAPLPAAMRALALARMARGGRDPVKPAEFEAQVAVEIGGIHQRSMP